MNHQKTLQNIKQLYDQGDITQIVDNTVWLFKNALKLGYNAMELFERTNDLGVKPNELGIAFGVALKQTDNSSLSKTDQELKKKMIQKFSKEIKHWEKGLD